MKMPLRSLALIGLLACATASAQTVPPDLDLELVTGGVNSPIAVRAPADGSGRIFIVGQTIEGYVIYPYLLGDRVELHAVWVIFALFAGGVAFGFLGVLLAVPMAATIGVVARFWLRRYLESPLYLDPPRTGR